jgi:DNA-binding protein YbaB
MAEELIAKLSLTKEDIVHLYHGGLLSVKINGKHTSASLEISCGEVPERKAMRIRFKTIDAE